MVNPLYLLHARRKLPAPSCDDQKRLQVLPVVLWGVNGPGWRTTLSRAAYAFAHTLGVFMPIPVGVPCPHSLCGPWVSALALSFVLYGSLGCALPRLLVCAWEPWEPAVSASCRVPAGACVCAYLCACASTCVNV